MLKLWRDRQVYPEAFTNGMIAAVDKALQDQKKGPKEELPNITFDIDDLYGFAYNKKHLEIWTEKVKELRTQLDIIFKNSRVASPKRSRSRKWLT